MNTLHFAESRLLFRQGTEMPKQQVEKPEYSHEFTMNVGPREAIRFQFDTYTQPVLFDTGTSKVKTSQYCIERTADGSLMIRTSLPFNFCDARNQWMRQELNAAPKPEPKLNVRDEAQALLSDLKKDVVSEQKSVPVLAAEALLKELQGSADEAVDAMPEVKDKPLLRSIAPKHQGWQAYEAIVPTGKSFSVRIGNYTNPLTISANTVTYGALDNSTGFYMQRTRGNNDSDVVTVEAIGKVSDAQIEK